MKRVLALLLGCMILLCGCRAVPDADGDRPVGEPFRWEERTVVYDGISLAYTDEIWYQTDTFSLPAARLSMALSDAAMVRGAHEPGADASLEQLLGALDFSDYESFGYTETPDTDTMAAGYAHRTVNGPDGTFTVLAVAARCGSYGREWAGNFTVGEGVEHKGFRRAAELLYEHAADYCTRYGITGDCVIWTVGFSRAAAASNLFAGRVAREGGIGGLSARLCAYSFETPAGTRDTACRSETYRGIYSVIGEEDLVPKVAPAAFGYARYGTDYVLPPFSDDGVRQTVENTYAALYPDAEPLSLSGSAAGAADRFIAYVCERVVSPEQYTARWQDGVRAFITALADGGYSTSESAKLMRSLISGLQDTVNSYRNGAITLKKARALADIALKGGLREAGLAGHEDFLDDIFRLAFNADADAGHDILLKSLIFALSYSPLSANEPKPDDLYSLAPAVLSLLTEAGTVMTAHMPRLCMARLMAI